MSLYPAPTRPAPGRLPEAVQEGAAAALPSPSLVCIRSPGSTMTNAAVRDTDFRKTGAISLRQHSISRRIGWIRAAGATGVPRLACPRALVYSCNAGQGRRGMRGAGTHEMT